MELNTAEDHRGARHLMYDRMHEGYRVAIYEFWKDPILEAVCVKDGVRVSMCVTREVPFHFIVRELKDSVDAGKGIGA